MNTWKAIREPLAIFGGPPVVQIAGPHFKWPLIGAEEENAVLSLLRRGELSYYRLGGIVQEFETLFAERHGNAYACSTHSGTGALHCAYFGLELFPGDEVIAPAYTHLGTVLPMLHANLIPVLCDIDEKTGNLDPAEAAKAITPRTKAIVVTHQYGHLCDMEAVLDLAKRHKLQVVEDCSHAHGATFYGKPAGSFGDVSCFSLQAHKTVVAGEGGILLTNIPRIFERAALLGHFRQPWSITSDRYRDFVETGFGLKNRLHPLAAAIALAQLRKMPETIASRQENLKYFTEKLKEVPGVDPLSTAPGVDRGGYFRFLVSYRSQHLNGLPIDTYFRALKMEGVCEVQLGSNAKPLHLTRLFQTLDDGMYPSGWPRRGEHLSRQVIYRPGDFPKAEKFSASTLQFPAFTEPSKHIIDAYCTAMVKVAFHSAALTAATKG